MPRKKLTKIIQKKTLNFREGDWDLLTAHYAPRGYATSVVIRTLVSQHVDKIRETLKSEEDLNV